MDVTVSTAGRSRCNIAVVEDDEALLVSLKFMFEIEGYSVLAYCSAESVMTALGTDRIDCLITDYYLSGTNGLDLISALRVAGVEAPAFLITTQPSVLLRQQAAVAGTAIVEKPLLGDCLVNRVRAALAQHAPMA